MKSNKKVPFFALFRLAPTKFIMIICTNTFKIVYNISVKVK